MRITYYGYFIQIFHFVDINFFISHAKRVDSFIVRVKFIDEFFILAFHQHWYRFFEYSSQYLPDEKKAYKCNETYESNISNFEDFKLHINIVEHYLTRYKPAQLT